jgi:DNA polymerase III delta subunit
MSEQLIDAIVNMREKEALEITGALIEGGEDPVKILGLCWGAICIKGG